MNVDAVRFHKVRESQGSLRPLCDSIRNEGMQRPVCIWQDGTLISGGRRLRAHLLLRRPAICGVFVSSIEEAAKHLQQDNEHGLQLRKMSWSEVCRLWDLLAKLYEPAAVARAQANRERGLQLRRETMSGKREPGRASGRGDNHFLTIVAPPFGISEASASRIYNAWKLATGDDVPEERRTLAREVMRDIDAGGNIWGNYKRLIGERVAPVQPRKKAPPAPVEPAQPARQVEAWGRVVPTLTGLMEGLAALGPPNPALTWDQVGPVLSQLVAARRDLERIVRQMKEFGDGRSTG